MKEAKGYDEKNIDSCVFICEKIDSLSQLCPTSFADYIIRANIIWADQSPTLEGWDQHLRKTEDLLETYGRLLNQDSLMKTKYLLQYERCRCEDNKGEYDKTLDCYTRLLYDLPEHLPDEMSLRFVLPLSIGLVYYEKGDYVNALIWNKLAEEHLPDSYIHYRGYLYDYYGKYYWAQGDLRKAEYNFKKSVEEFLKNIDPDDPKDKSVDAITDLASFYVSQKKWAQGEYYLEMAMKMRLEKDWSIAHIYHQYANLYFAQHKYTKALYRIDEAIIAAKKIKQGRYYLVGEYSSLRGEILAKLGDIDEAMVCFQEGLFHFSEIFESGNYSENPDPKNSPNKIGLLKTLDKKAEILLNNFKKVNSDLDFLNWSHSAYQSAISLIKILRTEYVEDKTKEFLSEQWFRVFESAIATADRLYRETGEPLYLEQAFKYSETSKALSLLENLADIQAKEFAGVPDETLQEEFSFKYRISKLEYLLDTTSLESKKAELRATLMREKKEFKKWIKKLESDYEAYFRLKYDPKVASLKEVQKRLSKEDVLIQYFYGEKKMYTFGVTSKKITFHSFPVTAAFNNSLNVFINSTRKRKGLTNEPKIKNFLKHGHFLYNKLIAPFSLKKKKIIIIPDGRLNNLPFSALPVNEKYFPNPKDLEYLLKKHIVTANYSASVMFRQKIINRKNKNWTKPLLIIAPENFPNNSQLEIETEDLEEKFAGKVKLLRNPNKEETLAALKTGFENIFIFTHAAASGKDPYLQLSNDTLFLRDLYANPIKAEMVLLGACETGLGRNQKGEGVLSLSRGFAYQNVPNTLMTLWKVREGTSYELSINFLDLILNKNLDRPEALHQVQLELLNNSSGNKLPFFWAGFVLVGE